MKYIKQETMVKEIGEMLNDILMALESPTEKKLSEIVYTSNFHTYWPEKTLFFSLSTYEQSPGLLCYTECSSENSI